MHYVFRAHSAAHPPTPTPSSIAPPVTGMPWKVIQQHLFPSPPSRQRWGATQLHNSRTSLFTRTLYVWTMAYICTCNLFSTRLCTTHAHPHIGRKLRKFTQLKRNKRFDNFIMLVWVQGSPFHIAAGSHILYRKPRGHKIAYTGVKFKSCFNVVKNHTNRFLLL